MAQFKYGTTMSDDALRGLIRRYDVTPGPLRQMSREKLLATVNAHELVQRTWADRFEADDKRARARSEATR